MQIIATENIDIMLVQEPYLYQEEIRGVSRKYRTYSYGEGRRRAAIILANNNLGALLITQHSDKDTVLLEIQQENEKYYAASIYMDYNATIDIDLKRIEKILTFTKGEKLLIATDSNCRSTAWHDTTTNNRGRMMEDFVASNQLHIINEERTLKTFQSSRGESNIDLTIVNNKMLANIQKWDISEEESASDHNIIKFNITLDKAEGIVINNPGRLRIKEHQYTEFYEKLQLIASVTFQIEDRGRSNEDLDEALSQKLEATRDIQEFTKKLEEVIQKAGKETSGSRNTAKQKAKGKTVPWWTNGLTIMRKKTNALRRRYQRTTSNDALRESRKTQYNKAKAEYQAAVRKEKTRSWKEYCTTTSPLNPWNEVYKLASNKIRSKTTITTLQKPDGTNTESTEETLRFILHQLTPDDNPQDDTYHHITVRKQTEQPLNTPNDKEFTQEEVGQVIEGLKQKKAPGPSGITNEITKLIFKAIPKTITSIYNECLRKGSFPANWKIAKVIPITKPGKEGGGDPSKYRPISLLNTEGKILEKLLIQRIMHHAYTSEALNKNQYGFTPQKNTVDAAMEVRQYIEPHLNKGGVAIIISLDVQGAFGSAWWPAILQRLRDIKCPRNLYYLVKDYLRERKAVMTVNNSSAEKAITRGCPQGACCGPGLWNIQYDTVLNLQYKKQTRVIAFADDLLVMLRAESIGEVENNANIEMDKIANWAKDNKITFNEEKSKVMLLTRRKRKEQKNVAVYLNNKAIPQVQKLKYLGIIFDYKLTFRDHINYIVEKCTKLTFALAKSAKINWGLGHKALRTIYVGGILPLLLYGAPVWIKAMEKEKYKNKVSRVQRLINIKMAKAYRTVSSEALCVVTGMTPIHLKIEQAAEFYLHTRSHIKDTEQFDNNKEARFWQHPAETVIRTTEGNEEDSPLQIYTDGSKTEKGVGSGIAIYRSGQNIRTLQFKLNKKCTNNQAEQLAILKALESIDNTQMVDKKATIYTDSQTTLAMLQNSKIHTNIIEDIRRQWYEMKKAGWQIALRWVKAHAGTRGNELADTLAKKATTNGTITESYTRIPKSAVLRQLEEGSARKWQRSWTQTTKGSTTKEYFPDIDGRLKMKLKLTGNLTTILTGHGNIKAYLHRFYISGEQTCPCGKGDQTTDHIIYDCDRLKEERDRLRAAVNKTDDWPTSKRNLIKRHYKEFSKFINSISFEELNAEGN
jgi:ribonuclease HI